MLKKKITRRLKAIAVLMTFLLSGIIPSGLAMAENYTIPGGAGGGNPSPSSSCSKSKAPATCYGSSWFKHDFEDGSLSLGGFRTYAKAFSVTQEQCHGARYFFYYSIVDRNDRALGLTGIGNADPIWRSSKLGGRNKYNGVGGISWDFAKRQYEIAYDRGETIASMYPRDVMDTGFTSNFSSFCSNMEEEPPEPPEPEPEPEECPLPDFIKNDDRGNSVAESAVVNLSKGEPWDLHTSNNGKNVTYAKPGDSVQFKHTYCYGASAVKHFEGWGQNSDRRNISISNTFKITAYTGSGGGALNKDYRFGGPGTNAKNKLQNSKFDDYITFTLGPGNHVAPLGGLVDYNKEYFFQTYSPAIDAGNRYDCLHIPFITTNPFLPPGYQINGFTTLQGACKSKNEVKQNSDPGTTIKQKLEWTGTRAWIEDVHFIDGRCNCNPSTEAVLENDKRVAFDDTHFSVGWAHPDYVGSLICATTTCKVDPGCEEDEEEGIYCDYMDGWSERTPKWRYLHQREWEFEFQDPEEVMAVIPYNYDTYASSSIDSGDDIFIGEQIDTSFNWGLVDRMNPDVYEQNSYATMSRPTRVQIVEFTVSPGVSGSEDKVTGSNKSESDPCGYYGGQLSAQGCHSIYDTGMIMNDKGLYSGSKNYSESFTRQLPDVEPGTKYCVAMGVWPADSHNRPDEALGEGDNHPSKGVFSGQETGFGYWRVANASCRTLYKKPTFQAWGAGLFSNKGISTAVSTKSNLGGGLSGNQGNDRRNPTNIFGSWDEYGVIAGGQLKGFASAAGYGYQPNLQIQPPGGDQHGVYKFCQNLSKLTLGGCNGVGGNVGVSDVVIDRLTARYLPSSNEVNLLPNSTRHCGTVSSYDACKQLTSGATYIRARDGANLANLIPTRSGIRADGNVDNSGTVVIDATGRTLNITGNICYLDPSCNSNNNPNYNGLRSNSTSITDIATLPQVIIFAKNINISQDVSQIDSWLIADGTINTCTAFSPGGYGSNGAVIRGTNTLVCNKTLTINGPVFARALALNRMAGANPGGGSGNGDTRYPHLQNLADDGSITPAEIFNLRPDTYYWAYSQAQRYSQALVTYTRELAPRY